MTPLVFPCEGAALVGCLHDADGDTGLLMLAGGGQTRVGAHRSFVRLAAGLAAEGYPVLRFDRRGIGDSGGEDVGFANAGPDIEAALAAFRRARPHLRRVVALGLCDGATALLLAAHSADALLLLNPWIIEEGAPASAATLAAHYRRRARQSGAWRRLLRGEVNVGQALRDALRGLRPSSASNLDTSVRRALTAPHPPAHVVLSSHDRTADAFAPLAAAMRGKLASSIMIDGDHVFSGAEAEAALHARVTAVLRLVAEEGLTRRF